MGCASDLPDTLVLKIILLAGNASTTTLKEWKANLPYAGVCRQWRKQIIDMVYGSAILECYKFGVVWTGWQNKVSLPYYTWKSNIDLFVATGNNHRATELRILLPRYEHSVLPIHDRLEFYSFANLKDLHLEFSEPNSMVSNLLNYPSDSKVFKLEFPVLKRLTVRNNPSTGHLLSSCLDLPTTAEISIDGEFNGLRQLGNMCYHNTASIISVEMRRVEKDDRAHFYMVTNDLYGRLTGANEMRLVLDDIGIAIDPQQIEWFNLTQLALKQGISFMN
ncbi:hypothetical protein GGI04_004604, partial [Coemansia thaxteri]